MENFQLYFLALAIMTGNAFAAYQDLTWVMDMDHISYHPYYARDEYRFKYNLSFAGEYQGNGTFASYGVYSTVEHMGTHIDAPFHFDEDGLTIDKVPLEDLIGPLVRVDLREKAKLDPDAILTVEDLQDWEKRNGRIPDGSFIIGLTGWDQFYGDNIKYVGTDVEDGQTKHPGFGKDASQWLIDNRSIKGVGSDTIGGDSGNALNLTGRIFPAHEILLPAQKVVLENLRSVDKVPECGAKISALPIILKNGTGTQARVFAEWYPGVGYMTDCNGKLKKGEPTFMTSAGRSQFLPILPALLILGLVLIN